MDSDENDTCAILDDTTFQKSGIRIKGVSKVFDHVTHSFIYGMKCLTLALSDGKRCYPIDFSIHREKGKKKDYGLTDGIRWRMVRYISAIRPQGFCLLSVEVA
mgnify:CR=1 FL=1